MPWIKSENGNVFEVDDLDHAAKIMRESPMKDGKPVRSAWDSDPRDKGAKPWKSEASEDAAADSE